MFITTIMKLTLFVNMLPIIILTYLIISNMMKFKNDPMMLLMLLIIYSILMSLATYMNSMESMNSMMILITMISGVMVMFTYFTSLINTPLKKNKKIYHKIILLQMFIFYLLFKQLKNMFSIKNKKKILQKPNKNMIKYMYLYPKSIILMIIIIILISTLYLVIKMCYISSKALRAKF